MVLVYKLWLQQVLDDGTDPWGVQVERVEMYVTFSIISQLLIIRHILT